MKYESITFLKKIRQWIMIPLLVAFSGMTAIAQDVHRIPNTVADTLEAFIEDVSKWSSGDIIMLESDGEYVVAGSIDILQSVTIVGDPSLSTRPVVTFKDNGFHVKDDSIDVVIKGIDFVGKTVNDLSEEHIAPFILRYSGGEQGGAYDLVKLEDVYATGFQGGVDLNVTKEKWYKKVVLNNVYFDDFTGSEWALDPNLNVVLDLQITNSTFSEVGAVLKNVYFNKDGTAFFGDVQQKLLVDHNTFYKIGDFNNSLIQLNDQNDGNLEFVYSNNIASGILNEDNSRLFRLNELAGSYTFENSVFHDFVSSNPDKDQFSLDSVSASLDNVTLVNVELDAAYPEFKDTTSAANPKSFVIPSGSSLFTAGKDGGPIGDPRWTATERAVADLEAFIENTSLWNPGDTIVLSEPEYTVAGSVDILQSIVIIGDPALGSRPVVTFKDNGFHVKDDSINVTIKGVNFIGKTVNELSEEHIAPFILRYSGGEQGGAYDLVKLEDVYATGFQGGVDLNVTKEKWYKKVVLNNVYFDDFTGSEWALDPNLNVVLDLQITNSTFSEVGAVLKNVYFNKDGTAFFGNVQQKLLVDHNTFYKIGDFNNSLIQLNDQNDGNLEFVYSNNIASGILNEDNSRLFRLNELAGSYTFENSVFHDFVSSNPDKDQFSLDSVSSLSNVTLVNVELDAAYPEFKDTTSAASPKSFLLPSGSALLTAGSDGGPVGDPVWASPAKEVDAGLEAFIENISLWNEGDTIVLTEPQYTVNGSIDVLQSVTIMGDPMMDKNPVVTFKDNGFHVKDDSINVAIIGVDFVGTALNADLQENIAPFILRYSGGDPEGTYDYVILEDVHAKGFRGGVDLNASKERWYKEVVLNNVFFEDFTGQEWALDPNLNVVEDLQITNSTFAEVGAVLKNVYFNKDGTGIFGSVPQKLVVDHNTFYKIGDYNNSLIQLNDQNDGNVEFIYSNNIASGILNEDNSRLFRLNELAGSYTFENSVFHDFVSSNPDKDQYSLDSVSAALDNVTLTDVTLDADDPQFADPENGVFTIEATSPAYIGDADGGYIGDPRWLPSIPGLSGERIHPIPNTADSLEHFMETLDPETGKPAYWEQGDTILLVSPGQYIVNGTIDIFQEVTVLGDPTLSIKPELRFYDSGFRLKEDSVSVTLKGFNMNGLHEDNTSLSTYILRFDQAGWYNYKDILIEDVEAWDFNGGVQLFKNTGTYYETVTLNKVYFHDIPGDFVLDPRLNVVEELTITNSTFVNVKGFVKNLYNNNDGAQEFGTVAQNVVIDHNTFYNVVSDVFIQMNDGSDGSVTLTYTNNVASTLLDDANSRPFRINADAGTFTFSNSVFHNFESSRDGGIYNLEAVATAQANVTTSEISTDDPEFISVTEPYNFSYPLSSELIVAGTNGGPIGDPRWFPEVGVSIVPLSEVVTVGNEVQMQADVTFGEGTDLSVTWSVKNAQNGTSGEASIDAETGVLNAIAEGDILVIATSNYSSSFKDSLMVNIAPPTLVTSIALSAVSPLGTETTIIDRKNGTLTVLATVLPGNATDKSITWSLSDESLATFTVDNETSIKLTALASGTLTIIATANDDSGVTGELDIVITRQNPPTGYTVTTENGETRVAPDETLQMIATRNPEDSDDQGVVWSITSGGASATISETGLLTAVSPGIVVVTVSSADPQNFLATGSLEITVADPLGLNPVSDMAVLYPNPVVNSLNLVVENKAEVRIANLTGQLLLKKEVSGRAELDVKFLRSGVYILTVQSGNEYQTIRFRKN